MDIFAVCALGVVGMLLAVMIKKTRPEMAIAISLITGICVIFYITDGLTEIFSGFYEIVQRSGINEEYFRVAVKVCIIAYITQFASELCKDAGEGAIAVKVELAGKVSIVVMSMPVISGFLQAMGGLLTGV
ncbi:MAG: stage III sporulation protein AD [Clostridia bacterium]|nr:stage III sporulation protein AD [Clostridia bacterium]